MIQEKGIEALQEEASKEAKKEAKLLIQGFDFLSGEIKVREAQACALLVVDKILSIKSLLPGLIGADLRNASYKESAEFWELVKKEINLYEL